MGKFLLLCLLFFSFAFSFVNCGGESQSRPETFDISQRNGKKYLVTLKCSVTGIERLLTVSAENPEEAKSKANRWARETGRAMSTVVKIILKNS